MKFLRFVLLGLLVVVVAVGAVLAYLLQDANRFKPRLEALIHQQTGVPLEIAGDLGWRLWPPVSISAETLRADHEGQAWQVGRLTLHLDALNLIADPRQWQVESLTLDDVTMRDANGYLEVDEARLDDLAPRRPAPFRADLTYTPAGQAPLPATLRGLVSVDPDTLELALADTRFETTSAQGTCDLQATPVADPAPAPPATEEDLVPVDVLLSVNWTGECRLDWAELADRRFEDLLVTLNNDAGASTMKVEAPRFFGGEGVADVAIDARAVPVRWTVEPTLTGVDSGELLAWLDQRLQWAAPLAYGGTLTFEGNTADELIASMSGNTRFDGGEGRIDIAAIKSQLAGLAAMFNEGERIEGWPDVWKYERFIGEWRIERQHHVLDMALDNLYLDVAGDYLPASDEIDMRAELTFENDPALPVFDLDPVLYGLPIPVRCRGRLDAPTCRIDPDAAQRIVSRALSGEDSELRRKLETKIDEEVPEQYRDAARSLLEALGGSSSRQRDN